MFDFAIPGEFARPEIEFLPGTARVILHVNGAAKSPAMVHRDRKARIKVSQGASNS
jgi:hypothetical protein